MKDVDRRVSPTDTMMGGTLERYLSVGDSAMKAIREVVGADFQPSSVLDIPCGHGRVARHLRAEYPTADLFVSDLDDAGVAFCVSTFNATKLPTKPDFDALDFGRSFDLIWVGSLITHLPEPATEAFFRFISRHLTKTGIAVVTSHGAFVAGRLFGRGKALYGLTENEERSILADYLSNGYGHRNYPRQKGYGISLISRGWLRSCSASAGLEMFAYADHAWDTHQDVLGLR